MSYYEPPQESQHEQSSQIEQPTARENETIPYQPVITEMTRWERNLQEFFTTGEKLNRAVQFSENKIAHNKMIDKCGQQFIFYLSGDKPVETKEELESLKKRLCKDTRHCRYIALGPPEVSATGKIHHHGIAIFDTIVRFQKIPKWERPDGNVMSIAFGDITSYSKNTGDFKKYIEYMNKKNSDPHKCYLMEDSGYLDKDGRLPEPVKRDIAKDWRTCMEMPNLAEAVNAMHDWHPIAFPSKEGQFTRVWNRKHYNENVRKQILDDNFVNWNFNVRSTRFIKKWINDAIKPENDRPGNLIIVGPTLTGKSQFINRFVVLPYDTFRLKGDLRFDNYDPLQHVDFYVFDDIELVNKEYIALSKTITSGKKGELVTKNIKYSVIQPMSAPIIHLMNYEKFHRFVVSVEGTGSYDAWWKDNMDIIIVEEYLYPTDKVLSFTLNDEGRHDRAKALKHIRYRHPNKKHVSTEEESSGAVEEQYIDSDDEEYIEEWDRKLVPTDNEIGFEPKKRFSFPKK